MIEAEALLSVFEPGQVAHWAKATGFIRRERALSGFAFLLLMTVGRAGLKQPSLAALAGALRPDMSREALHQRFTPAAAAFLQCALNHVLRQTPAGRAALAAEALAPFRRVLIVDSSSWEVPPGLRHVFRGHGGDSSAACCKLQLCYDFKSGELAGTELTPGTHPDNAYTSVLPSRLRPEDLILFDQGYFKLDTFSEIHRREAFFLTRLLASTQLLDARDGVPFDLAERLDQVAGDAWEMPVLMGGRVPVRLICLRVSEQVAGQRRQKLLREARNKGQQSGQRRLRLCSWTLLITNAPAALIPAELMLLLYTLRWQIELLFKQFKSTLGIHHATSGQESRLRCEVYGCLILAALILRCHAVINNRLWNQTGRELSLNKLCKRIQERCFVLLERFYLSFRHAWQYLEEEINRLINDCLKTVQKNRPSSLRSLGRPSGLRVLMYPLDEPAAAEKMPRTEVLAYA
ncbi:MAG TPA: IS4 family transposase [Kiritimatiellia bacterium]|nr:IS4 family transposase [Kiritimatiellia bacterium]